MRSPVSADLTGDFTREQFIAEFPCPAHKVEVFSTIDSTNAHLLRRAQSLQPLLDEAGTPTANGCAFDHTVALASSQSAGRGRLGRTFYSPDASGVYFSIALVPTGGIKDPAPFTAAAAVGVCQAVEGLLGEFCLIKWVNDIFLRGKKVCGILCEGVVNPLSQLIEAVVVGVGINVLPPKSLPPDIKAKAGFLCDQRLLHARNISRMQVAARCVKAILLQLDSPAHEAVLGEYKRRSMLLGKTVTVHPVIGDRTSFSAHVLDVADDFSLVVRLADGSQKRLHSGEVSLHED